MCQLLEKQEHLISHAYCALYEGRLAVERGEAKTGAHKLDEAIAIAQSLQDEDILAEAYCVLLDAAIQTASPKEAQRAIHSYQRLEKRSNRDHWPATLARWHWLLGDIDQAQEVLQEERQGFSNYLIQIERIRMLIISGKYEKAITLGLNLKKDQTCKSMQDIQLFISICLATVQQSPKESFSSLQSLGLQNQWVEIYLGILHMETIFNRLCKKEIKNTLKTLQSRAKANSHQLYMALGDPRFW